MSPRPCTPHDHTVICCLPKTTKANDLFLKKGVTAQMGCGAVAAPVAEVTHPDAVLLPGSWSLLVTQVPLHPPPPTYPPRPCRPTASFNTPAASPKPGSLLSVRFYFGSLDSALEFYKPGRNWPGLGTFLCPCLPSHNAPVLCIPRTECHTPHRQQARYRTASSPSWQWGGMGN